MTHLDACTLVNECLSMPGFLFPRDLASMIDILEAHCPKTDEPIAEVGVYCGRSTHLLSHYGHVIGVDGYVMDSDPSDVNRTRFELFSDNHKRFNFDSELWPVMSTSGARKANNDGLKFKAIFIDASHDYKSVKEDLVAWKPLLIEDGLMFGDDLSDDFPGVERALNEELLGYHLSPHGKIWFYKNAK